MGEHENMIAALKEIADTGGTDMATLMAQLIQSNYEQYATTTQQIIDLDKERIEELENELATVRNLIQRLLNGPYMPTPDTIVRCLFPDKEQLARRGQNPGPA